MYLNLRKWCLCDKIQKLTTLLIILLLIAGLNISAEAAQQARIKSIKTLTEGVLFFIEVNLDRPIMPQVKPLYGDSENPRLVMDFSNTVVDKGVPGLIISTSRLAKQIRIGQHEKKVRVVVDLVPGFYYEADQVLYKKLNRYVIGLKVVAKPPDSSKTN